MDNTRAKAAAAWLSVISNTILIVMKITVGVLIGSVSVISEAIHSGVDLVAAIIALLAVKHSGKPADERHAYGHGKLENLSGTVEALLIFGAAGWIIYEAVHRMYSLATPISADWGVAVMAFSAGANWLISGNLMRVGKQTDSVALQADAWHLRTDVYTSLGVMGGLGLIALGDKFFPELGNNLHVIDPLAAIAVALLIVKAAWDLTVQSARDLMDVTLPPDEEEWIRQTVGTFGDDIHGYHRLRTRKSGSYRFIEFHIFVDADMTVRDSHALAHKIARKIEAHFGSTSVLVHVEPCDGKCGRHGK